MASERQGAFGILLEMDRRNHDRRRHAEEQLQESGRTQYIRYRVGDTLLLTAVGEVIELLPVPAITPVPFSKPWVAGVTNIRGDVYVVTDFYNFLFDEVRRENKRNKLLVLRGEAQSALIVDEVIGMADVVKDDIQQDTKLADAMIAPFVSGMVAVEGNPYFVLDVNELVTEPRFMQAAV